MAKYRKKPVVIEAKQWFQLGDHEKVGQYDCPDEFIAEEECEHCGGTFKRHGWIKTLEGGHIVCPGDYIITGVQGEHYPCQPDIFAETYERVEWEG